MGPRDPGSSTDSAMPMGVVLQATLQSGSQSPHLYNGLREGGS